MNLTFAANLTKMIDAGLGREAAPPETFVAVGRTTEYTDLGPVAVASFETNVEAPLRALSVALEPIQDLHGMPYPYPADTTRNLIPDGTNTENGYVANNYLRVDGTLYAYPWCYVSEYFTITEGDTYTWSIKNQTANMPSICFYDANKNFISGIQSAGALPKTFTAPVGAVYARSSQYIPITEDLFQLEEGSEATTQMYPSNICPIEGRENVEIYQTSENLLPLSLPNTAFSGSFGTDSKTISAATNARCWCMYVGKNQKLRYRRNSNSATIAFAFADWMCTARTEAYLFNAINAQNRPVINFDSGEHPYILICIANASSLNPGGAFDIAECMLSLGDKNVPYVPRRDISRLIIPLGDTVYGGSLDVVAGKLYSEWANIASYDGEELPGEWLSSMDVYSEGATPTTGAQVCYKLAEPVEITLTPEQITTLIGQNNVWSDGGDVSLTYGTTRYTEGY